MRDYDEATSLEHEVNLTESQMLSSPLWRVTLLFTGCLAWMFGRAVRSEQTTYNTMRDGVVAMKETVAAMKAAVGLTFVKKELLLKSEDVKQEVISVDLAKVAKLPKAKLKASSIPEKSRADRVVTWHWCGPHDYFLCSCLCTSSEPKLQSPTENE